MNPRKSLVIVAVLAVAVAAFVVAAPVSALSSVWKDKGVNVTKKVEMKLSGSEVIETGGAAMICNSTATMTTEGGSTAQITAYSVNKESCTGLSGNLVGCTVSSVTPSGLPWSVNVNTVDLTAKNVKSTYAFKAGCAVSSIELNYPELIVTPEEPSSINLFRFSQEGTGKVNGSSATIGYFGSLQFPEAEYGTYSIG